MKLEAAIAFALANVSHPARGAWIETRAISVRLMGYWVAPREGCVD